MPEPRGVSARRGTTKTPNAMGSAMMEAVSEVPDAQRGDPRPTVRALATGSVLGAVLGVANLYVGLRVGWSVGVVVTAAVLGGASWTALRRIWPSIAPLGLLEGAALSSTASAAGYSTGATLASAAAAYAIMTGAHVSVPVLSLWVLAVAGLGVCIAAPLRRRLLERDRLPFPTGRAAAQVLKQQLGGDEVHARPLLMAAALAGLVALFAEIGTPAMLGAGLLPAVAVTLGWSVPWGLVAPAAGALMGPRIAASLAVGALLSFALGPAVEGSPLYGVHSFAEVASWAVWPGSALMVSAGVFSLIPRRRARSTHPDDPQTVQGPELEHDVPRRWVVSGLLGCAGVAVVVQVVGFGVQWSVAVISIAFAGVLAVVAAKVVGETDVGPAGPLGKVAQLGLGPLGSSAAVNVMGAGVSAAAASSAADLLTDLKVGQVLGARPRTQFIAQCLGVLVGAAVVVPAFVWIVVPDPSLLGTSVWPAPAAKIWAAFAELAVHGGAALPDDARIAGWVALGVAIPWSFALRDRVGRWLPSPVAVGLAFVLPPGTTMAMAAGAAVATWLQRTRGEGWVAAVAGGAIAGESLVSVALSMSKMVH